MELTERLKLSEKEKGLELAKYFYVEQPQPGVLEQQILDAGPMDPADAIPPEHFTDLAANAETYYKKEFGYCMFDDRRGYIANYLKWNNMPGDLTRWWYSWININHKDVPKEDGCLHYKVWFPGEHYDHGFINGKDRFGGVYGIDYDADGNLVRTDRYNVSITDFGISPERAQELKEKGYMIDCAWETGEGGMHLSLNMSRRCEDGSIEKRTRTWIGYGIVDGKIVKDENACCTEKMLYNMLRHQNAEGRYMEKLVPELYEKYGHLPADEV